MTIIMQLSRVAHTDVIDEAFCGESLMVKYSFVIVGPVPRARTHCLRIGHATCAVMGCVHC